MSEKPFEPSDRLSVRPSVYQTDWTGLDQIVSVSRLSCLSVRPPIRAGLDWIMLSVLVSFFDYCLIVCVSRLSVHLLDRTGVSFLLAVISNRLPVRPPSWAGPDQSEIELFCVDAQALRL